MINLTILLLITKISDKFDISTLDTSDKPDDSTLNMNISDKCASVLCSFINVSQEQYMNDFVNNNMNKYELSDCVIKDGVCKDKDDVDYYGGNVSQYTGFIRLLCEKYYDLRNRCDILCCALLDEDCCIYICVGFC